MGISARNLTKRPPSCVRPENRRATERRPNVLGFEKAPLGEEFVLSCALGKKRQHVLNGQPLATDARLAAAMAGIDRDAGEHFHSVKYRLSCPNR